MLGLYGSAAARDCSPPRSKTTIEALIETLRAPGLSAPCRVIEALFATTISKKARLEIKTAARTPKKKGILGGIKVSF